MSKKRKRYSSTDKEHTMKSRHFTYLWNTAAALLLVLCFNVISAFGQTVILVSGPSVPGYFGDALSFDGVSGGVVLPERYQWNLDLTGNRVNGYNSGRDPRVFTRR